MTIRIEIQEQPERKRFWAEVEIGGMIARRREVWSPKEDGLSGILAVVYAAAAEIDPRVREDALRQAEENPINVDTIVTRIQTLDALRAEAETAGVRVDGRWGEDRLRQEIASAAASRGRTAHEGGESEPE